MKWLKYLDDHFEEVVCAVFLTLIVAFLGIQVFFRFFLGRAWAWQEELTRFLFVWFNYLGVSLGAKRFGHIRVTTFVNFFPERWRDKVILLADIVWLFFNLAVVVVSFELLKTMLRFPMLSAAMGWNLFWIYLIIPLGFLLTSYRILQGYYRKFRTWSAKRG